MADAPKLPPLPAPAMREINPFIGRGVLEWFDRSQMLAAMAQAAREQRDRDAAICDKKARELMEEARPSFIVVEHIATAIRSQLEPVQEQEKIR